MEIRVKEAKNIAKRAVRKAAKRNGISESRMHNRKQAMRQYKKMVRQKQDENRKKLKKPFTRKVELAVGATIGLGVLAVAFPQISILPVVLSILILAAFVDHNMKKQAAQVEQKNEDKWDDMLRMVQTQKNKSAPRPVRNLKVVEPAAPKKLEKPETKLIPQIVGLSEVTYTEFPYKHLRQ
jgi:aminopeptidase N